MSVSCRLWPVAVLRRPQSWRIGLPAALAACALLTACASQPDQLSAASDAADSNAAVAPTAYRSVLGGYTGQRPVEPMPWVERNRSVTPQPKTEGR